MHIRVYNIILVAYYITMHKLLQLRDANSIHLSESNCIYDIRTGVWVLTWEWALIE